MRLVRMKSGDEYDALTRSGRRCHSFRAGQRKAIKRKFNRRERKSDLFKERAE